MQILLTNDDGVHAEGLHAAWKALSAIAQVFVCVPDRPRSGCSHAITMHKPLRAEKVETVAGTAYISNGTPADCVMLAQLQLMPEPPDLIVSGINLGANLGDDVIYSGTVAGAMEGAMNGVPSFAMSLVAHVDPIWEVAAAFCAEFAPTMRSLRLPKDTFININVPNVPRSEIKGVRATTQGSRRYKGDIVRYEAPAIGTYYWRGGEVIDRSETEDTDILAIKNNYIAVTPLHVDLTSRAALETLATALPQVSQL